MTPMAATGHPMSRRVVAMTKPISATRSNPNCSIVAMSLVTSVATVVCWRDASPGSATAATTRLTRIPITPNEAARRAASS